MRTGALVVAHYQQGKAIGDNGSKGFGCDYDRYWRAVQVLVG
jgi:hypothetical protein